MSMIEGRFCEQSNFIDEQMICQSIKEGLEVKKEELKVEDRTFISQKDLSEILSEVSRSQSNLSSRHKDIAELCEANVSFTGMKNHE